MTTATVEQTALALEIARDLIRYDIPVFRAEPDPSGGTGGCGYKLPPGWQRTRPDESVVDAWRPGDALCMVTGCGLDGLDTDPRHGGHDARQELVGAGLWPFVLGVAATPSGGTHELVNPLAIGSRDAFRPGVDFKGGKADGTGRGFLFIAPTARVSKTTGELLPYVWTAPPTLDEMDDADDSGESVAELIRKARSPIQPPAGEVPHVAYDQMRPEQRHRVNAYIERLVQAETDVFADIATWPERRRDDRGRGWEKCTADVANRLGRIVRADWNALTYTQARAHLDTIVPEKVATAVDLKRKWQQQRDRREPALYPAPLRTDDGIEEWRMLPGSNGTTPSSNGNASATTDASLPPRRPRITWATEIEPEPVTWAWQDDGHGRIPAGALSVAAGREGTGKSSFAIWLAAQVTRGTLPGSYYGRPRNVLYVAVEDSWRHTIVPRLIAAGADLSRVGRFDVVNHDGDELTLSLPHDNALLETAITEHDVALVPIDPLLSVIAATIDSYKSREVRSALDPLAKIADRTGSVLLGIAHFNKGSGTDASALITGSGAFKDVPRAVFGFARDDGEGEGAGQRVMTQTKNSLGPDGPSKSYVLEEQMIETKSGLAITSRFRFTGHSDRSVGDLLRDSRRDSEPEDQHGCVTWLKTLLADGRMQASEVYRAADAAGFSKDQAKRAKQKASVIADKDGMTSPWYWRLPDDADDEGSTKGAKGAGAETVHPSHSSAHPSRDPAVDEPADNADADSPPESCIRCGQSILLRVRGRDTCARCEKATTP